MSVGVLERSVTGSDPEPTTGGVAARRAMIRWAWRLFKREWRQQLLILLLVIVAVAAVVVTHDAQLAAWADRVVFLRDGRIVDQTLPIDGSEAVLADLPNQ